MHSQLIIRFQNLFKSFRIWLNFLIEKVREREGASATYRLRHCLLRTSQSLSNRRALCVIV